jgi:hypothetical protein
MVWQFRGKQRPVKLSKLKGFEVSPSPAHVIQCQMQMDALDAAEAYLVYWTVQSGAIAFRIERDNDLLRSMGQVLKEIHARYGHTDSLLPVPGYTSELASHAAFVDDFARAMKSPKPCWALHAQLRPKFRGDPAGSPSAWVPLHTPAPDSVIDAGPTSTSHSLGLLSDKHTKVWTVWLLPLVSCNRA